MATATKSSRFYIRFLTDDATLKNRHNFIVYVRRYPVHSIYKQIATLLGESALISNWQLGNKLQLQATLLGESSVICTYEVNDIQHYETATLSAESSLSCQYSVNAIARVSI